jgi:hypothetical protein
MFTKEMALEEARRIYHFGVCPTVGVNVPKGEQVLADFVLRIQEQTARECAEICFNPAKRSKAYSVESAADEIGYSEDSVETEQ